MTSWKQGKWGKKDKSTTCSTDDASPRLGGQWGQRSALEPTTQVRFMWKWVEKWLLQWYLLAMPTVTKQLVLVWFISTNTPTERSRARRTASAGAIRQWVVWNIRSIQGVDGFHQQITGWGEGKCGLSLHCFHLIVSFSDDFYYRTSLPFHDLAY